MAATDDPLLGRRIAGRYDVVRVVGQGAMGAVYEVRHAQLEKRFALKRILPQSEGNEQALARFRREAAVVARLDHPNVVQIVDWHTLEEQGTPYMVLEFVAGETLAKRIARGPLPWPRIAALGDQMLAALCAVHGVGVVHRDLKPGNIMISTDGSGDEQIKVLDFGIARDLTTGTLHGSGTGLIGTPLYMSPEQASHDIGSVGPASDVWAAAAILYEMATARPAFDAASLFAILDRIADGEPDPIAAFRNDVPPAFAAVIARALSKRPDDRGTAADLRLALRAALAGGRPHTGANADATSTVRGHASPSPVPIPPVARYEPLAEHDFVVGVPVPDARRFFGRDALLRRLYSYWQRMPMQHVAVVGARRSGKTSLLHQLARIAETDEASLRPDQRELARVAPRGVRWLFVDLKDPKLSTGRRLLGHILQQLGAHDRSECELDEFAARIGLALARPAVLLLDEPGAALARPDEFLRPFWDGLRAVVTNDAGGKLGLCMVAPEAPSRLAERYAKTSTFFNIFSAARIGPLADAEARALVASAPRTFAADDVAWMLAASKLWPAALSHLCRDRLASLDDPAGAGDDWRGDAVVQLDLYRELLGTT